MNTGNDSKIPAGEGIMPCGDDLTSASWPGSKYCGQSGPGNDSRIPAGDGIMPSDKAPFGQ